MVGLNNLARHQAEMLDKVVANTTEHVNLPNTIRKYLRRVKDSRSSEVKSLLAIWRDTCSTIFRVRDAHTLHDYLVTGVTTWYNQLPTYMNCVKCEEWTFGSYDLDCSESRYGLLSSPEELKWLMEERKNHVVKRVKLQYRRGAKP